MYAVVETGGKQYKVDKGALLKVERLDAELGKTVEWERVLLISDGEKVTVGRPFVAGAKVVGEVVRQGRGRKVHSYKYKPRKHSETLRGHRQYYTQIKVLEVVPGK
ncbi:50S ribosomal protein L21 [candidate division FCPU426 bacterium]|nr:50S ribosomal protein L21 [candidate division FCPU426 bacterium]